VPTRVRITCDASRAVLRAVTSTGEARSEVAIDDVPTVALARTLALAAAELVLNPVPEAPAVEPPPQPVSRLPSVERWWLRASGGVEGFSSLLGGGGVSAAVRAGPLWFVADIRVAGASRSFVQGRVLSVAVDGVIGALLRPRLGRVLVPLGLGVRVGHAWLTASPEAGVDAGGVRGVRVAPVALVGFHVVLWERVTVGADVQLGWALRGLQGLVDGTPEVALVGAVAVVSLGVGVTW
jgi:hypothetical protein